jgi:hypothetical protein
LAFAKVCGKLLKFWANLAQFLAVTWIWFTRKKFSSQISKVVSSPFQTFFESCWTVKNCLYNDFFYPRGWNSMREKLHPAPAEEEKIAQAHSKFYCTPITHL